MTKAKPSGNEALPDRGCLYAPRCVSCPFRKCIKELDAATRAEFIVAWRVLAAHMAEPDSAIQV